MNRTLPAQVGQHGQDPAVILRRRAADLQRRLQALGGLAGRHPDVGQHHLGAHRLGQPQQLRAIPGHAGHVQAGVAETPATASPFAVNDFFTGSGSINAQAAGQAGQNRRGGVSFTERFAPTANPTLALPLAGGRGFWMIAILTQRGTYTSAAGLRAKNWPDGNQVATPRPAVVHRETDTFITTYTAIAPLRSAGTPAGSTLTLDGFFGWPLTAVAD
jgi:hypothetical protein